MPETIEAYGTFVRLGRMGVGDLCKLRNEYNEAFEVLEDSAVAPGMTNESLTSMSLCAARSAEALDAYAWLISMPDFTPDISIAVPPFTEQTTGSLGVWEATRLLVARCWSMATRDAAAATSEALAIHRHMNAALPRAFYYRHVCEKGAEWSVLTASAIVRWKGDADLARSALEVLEKDPLPLSDLRFGTADWEVYLFLTYPFLGSVREAKRFGYPVDLSSPRSAVGMVALCHQVYDDYPVWVRGSGRGGTEEFSGRLPYEEGWADEGELLFSGFLGNRNLGFFSTAALELNLLRYNEWPFGHYFPLKDMTRWTADGQPRPTQRPAYDLARLNIAAVIFKSDTGRWPARVSDVVPRYLRRPIGSSEPGEMQGYRWSPSLNAFVRDDGYNPFVTIGTI
jgi:hypothetical protein